MATGAGINLATMRASVLSQIGIEATDIDTPGDTTQIDLLINKSWWELMDKIGFKEKEDTAGISLTPNVDTYTLASILASGGVVFDALRSVHIKDPNTGNFSSLREISISAFESARTTDTSTYSIPDSYARDGGNLYFSPAPDIGYTVRLYFLKILSDVPSTGPIVNQAFHEIIELGAVYRGHMKFRDFNSAREVRSHQLALLESSVTTDSKEDANRHYTGVEIYGISTGRRY